MDHPRSKDLQAALDQWQKFAPCLGTNVTIYDSKHGYWNAAAGFTTPDTMAPLQPGERFYIYSITKTFTAIVIMNLVEGGLISLDDPVGKHLQSISLPDSVTIRRLLNHTSGVPSYTDLAEYQPATREYPSNPWSFEQTIELTCQGKLDFEPGEKWHYSNTGYMLLLLIAESVTNESFAENIQKYIAREIGLKDTYLAETIDNGRITNGWCRSLNADERMENIIGIYHPWWCKTGLVVSTSLEVTKLYENLFAGNLVNQQSLEQMTVPTPIMQPAGPMFKKPSYGFGLMIDPENDFGGVYGHGGGGPGFNTWAVYYPDFHGRPIIITVLCNTSMPDHPFYLVKDLLRVL